MLQNIDLIGALDVERFYQHVSIFSILPVGECFEKILRENVDKGRSVSGPSLFIVLRSWACRTIWFYEYLVHDNLCLHILFADFLQAYLKRSHILWYRLLVVLTS